MAEEVKVTPPTETIVAAPKVEKAEGSVASIEAPAPTAAPVEKPQETVPLSVFLSVKDDVKDLKQQLKDATKPQTTADTRATVKALTEQYKDVDPNFIKGLVDAAVAETEAKYTPIIERQNSEKKQEQFDKAFDAIYDKAVADNPDAKNVDKEVIKALALTPKYNNTPVAELIKTLYSNGAGKVTTENDTRGGGDLPDENIDIDKVTPEQRAKIMADPAARKKYFDKLDALGR